MRDIEGVMKVALRTKELFPCLRPELETAKEICLLGSILRKDFFRQPDFLEILKAKESVEEFKLRLCIY